MKKAAPFLLRFPKSPTRLEAARDFDRGHSLASLLLPPAAVGSLPPLQKLFYKSREILRGSASLFTKRKNFPARGTAPGSLILKRGFQ